MTTIKRFNARLNILHSQVMEQITTELQRINRKVLMDELDYNPFDERTAAFTKAIELGEDGDIVVHTSFRDIASKKLHACLADDEITSYSLIALLELLMKIKN